MRTPILGGMSQTRTPNAADNRLINLFPEVVPEGGKTPAFLQRCPGLRYVNAIGDGPIRALWLQANGSAFYVVSGTELYKMTAVNNPPVLLGTVTGSGPVSIADNGSQLFLACNPDGYIYNYNTNVFAQITDIDFPGAVTVAYLDGWFLFNEPNSQRIWVTALLDGTSIDPLDYQSAEGAPDEVVAVAVIHREAWIFGTGTTEIWYASGGSDFPLSRIQGTFNEVGCMAPYSVVAADNSLFWLGQDPRGRGIVYQATGYQAQRISTHAVEWQVQDYQNLQTTIAYTYQQDGHTFLVMTFPPGNATWSYDVATRMWHQRAAFENGDFARHRGNCQCAFNGEVLVGDFENANIYALDLDVYSDNGDPQKWLRSWRALPTGTNNLTRTVHHELQLDCQVGVGLITGQGSDPQAMLRWSDDGGHTWSNEHWATMGAIGATATRVNWHRLGMTLKSRDRVYEVSGTDPVKIAIMGAELRISRTNA